VPNIARADSANYQDDVDAANVSDRPYRGPAAFDRTYVRANDYGTDRSRIGPSDVADRGHDNETDPDYLPKRSMQQTSWSMRLPRTLREAITVIARMAIARTVIARTVID
jgi:hypothetical protein